MCLTPEESEAMNRARNQPMVHTSSPQTQEHEVVCLYQMDLPVLLILSLEKPCYLIIVI